MGKTKEWLMSEELIDVMGVSDFRDMMNAHGSPVVLPEACEWVEIIVRDNNLYGVLYGMFEHHETPWDISGEAVEIGSVKITKSKLIARFKHVEEITIREHNAYLASRERALGEIGSGEDIEDILDEWFGREQDRDGSGV